VTAPDLTTGFHQTISTKCNLEKACLEEAGRQFAQAKHMPLLSHPLVNEFGETSFSSTTFDPGELTIAP